MKGQAARRHATASPQKQSEFHLRSELRWTGCPWRRSSRCPGETVTNKVWCLSRPSRRAASPAEQATTADAAKIGSLPLKENYESRASEDVLRGVGQGSVVTACAGSALPLEEKTSLLAQIRITLCDIKLAAGKRQRAAPARGIPRDPVLAFYDHTMCSYLTGAQSTGRAVAPPSAPTPQIGKDGRANERSLPLRGEHDAGGSRRRENRVEHCRWFVGFFPRALVLGNPKRRLLEWKRRQSRLL